MKKVILYLLILAMCLPAALLTACSNQPSDVPGTSAVTTEPVVTEPPVEPDPDTPGYLYKVVDGKAVITGYEGDATELAIPAWAGGVYVRSVERFAFASRQDITAVTFPSSLRSVDEYAFYHCKSLKTVTFAEGTTVIGQAAFNACSALSEVTLPGTLQEIGDFAFEHCTALETVALPDSLTAIGDTAFSSSGLTSASVGPNVKTMGAYIFYNCKSLRTASVKASVSELPDGLFTGCLSLQSVELPETVETVNAIFLHCESLESVTFPGPVVSIAQNCFHGCMALKTVTFEQNALSTIAYYAFHFTPALTDVYYAGSESDWNSYVSIGDSNEHLDSPTVIHFGNKARVTVSSIDETRAAPDLSGLAIGDVFSFGYFNKTELQWRVLDRQGDRLLVILNSAVSGITNQRFADELGATSGWSDCYARNYLQDTMYANAFNKNEKAHVALTRVPATTNGTADSDDYLFILSRAEAEQYFADDAAREFDMKWWLREPTTRGGHYYALVYSNGEIDSASGSDWTNGCAYRPAMWLTVGAN